MARWSVREGWGHVGRRPIWGAAQIQRGRGAEPAGPGSGLGGGDVYDSCLGSAVAVGSDGWIEVTPWYYETYHHRDVGSKTPQFFQLPQNMVQTFHQNYCYLRVFTHHRERPDHFRQNRDPDPDTLQIPGPRTGPCPVGTALSYGGPLVRPLGVHESETFKQLVQSMVLVSWAPESPRVAQSSLEWGHL